MPGGSNNEINALYQIACSTAAMATAAGGTPIGSGYVNDESALWQIIACNMYVTSQALGGTCAPLWVDEMTAQQAVLQLSAELSGLTGTSLAIGSYELPQPGIFCNLQQVAINTGQAASGNFGGNQDDLALLNSIACVAAQIATNGFAPPPTPIEAFRNALLAFHPDRLYIAGLETFQDAAGTTPATTTGQPVRRINDLAGSGDHLRQISSSPTNALFQSTGAGGQPSVLFSGAGTDSLFDNYVNTGNQILTCVAFNPTTGSGRVVSLVDSGGTDTNATTWCDYLPNNQNVKIYNNGDRAFVGTASPFTGVLHVLTSSVNLGANQTNQKMDSTAGTPDVTSGSANFTIAHFGIDAIATSGSSGMQGQIPFAIVFSTIPSGSVQAQIQTLVKNFYGTP